MTVSNNKSYLQEKGWWKFEFCYGKYVNQYHDESSTSRIIVELVYFDLLILLKSYEFSGGLSSYVIEIMVFRQSRKTYSST